MLKVGILGAGHIAESFHLPAWQQVEGVQIHALCDIRKETVTALADKFSIPNRYSSLETMLASDLDIIDICTPNTLHAEHILKSLDHEKHVLVEKPMVTSSSDADQVIRKAKLKNKKVMCAQHQRFRPETLLARKMILEGTLGDIYCVRAQAIKSRGIPERNGSFTDIRLSGGGPLMDLGSHVIDAAWWLMGCPKPVTAYGTTFRKLVSMASSKTEIEDCAFGHLKFSNGALISVETSYLLNSSADSVRCEVFGTKGGLLWPDLIYTKEGPEGMERRSLELTDTSRASVNELNHFVACIRENKSPLVPLEESRTVISMIEALYLSSKKNSEVRLI